MIKEETIAELNNLQKDCRDLFNRKLLLQNKLKEELESDNLRLICVDNKYYNIYVTYTGEKTDIKEIAASMGCVLEHTFKKKDSSTYLLYYTN